MTRGYREASMVEVHKAIAAKLGMELQIEDMAFGRNYSGSNKRGKARFLAQQA